MTQKSSEEEGSIGYWLCTDWLVGYSDVACFLEFGPLAALYG
jgi:hypothetical protein